MYHVQSMAIILKRDIIGFSKFENITAQDNIAKLRQKVSSGTHCGFHYLYKSFQPKFKPLYISFSSSHFNPIVKLNKKIKDIYPKVLAYESTHFKKFIN